MQRDRRPRARRPARVSSRRMRIDLGPLLVLQRDDVVVELDRGQRLDEEARARARAAVDDPRQLALVLGLEQQHVAVVARRDDAVLQQPLGVAAAQVALHHGRELRLQAQERAAQRRRAAARRRPPPRPRAGARGGRPPRPRSCPGPRRRAGRAAGAPSTRATRRAISTPPSMNEARSASARGSRWAPRARATAERLGRVGQVVVGLAADGAEQRHTLARPGQRLADGAGIGRGLQGLAGERVPRRSPPAAAGALESCRTPVL